MYVAHIFCLFSSGSMYVFWVARRRHPQKWLHRWISTERSIAFWPWDVQLQGCRDVADQLTIHLIHGDPTPSRAAFVRNFAWSSCEKMSEAIWKEHGNCGGSQSSQLLFLSTKICVGCSVYRITTWPYKTHRVHRSVHCFKQEFQGHLHEYGPKCLTQDWSILDITSYVSYV